MAKVAHGRIAREADTTSPKREEVLVAGGEIEVAGSDALAIARNVRGDAGRAREPAHETRAEALGDVLDDQYGRAGLSQRSGSFLRTACGLAALAVGRLERERLRHGCIRSTLPLHLEAQ
jgi:hypothetical protein